MDLSRNRAGLNRGLWAGLDAFAGNHGRISQTAFCRRWGPICGGVTREELWADMISEGPAAPANGDLRRVGAKRLLEDIIAKTAKFTIHTLGDTGGRRWHLLLVGNGLHPL